VGWANCGVDASSRPIGYGVTAFCDHSGCSKEIDRGLAYACGGMHGDSEYSCEKYFCEDHMGFIFIECIAGQESASVCKQCEADWEEHHTERCILCANAIEN
jgi:hypothetical protein